MLNISDQTFATFAAQAQDAFVQGVASSLAEHLPAEAGALARPDLEAVVQRTIDRAKNWQIEDDHEIGKLCAIALGCGEDVLDDPAVAEYPGAASAIKAAGNPAAQIAVAQAAEMVGKDAKALGRSAVQGCNTG